MNKFTYTVIFCLFTLVGCKEEAKTVVWFKDNPTELEKVYDECKKTGEDSKNCNNAITAHRQIARENAPIPTYSPVN